MSCAVCLQVNSVKNLTPEHQDHALNLSFLAQANSSEEWMNNAGAMTVSLDHHSYHTSVLVFALYKNVDLLLGN